MSGDERRPRGDALDAIGIWNQAMSPRIRPLDESLKLCGRARTGQYMEVPFVAEGSNPYALPVPPGR